MRLYASLDKFILDNNVCTYMKPHDYIICLVSYLSLCVFIVRTFSMCMIWLRGGSRSPELPLITPAPLARYVAELLTLLRLLKVNGWIWVGEWLFHASLLFIFMRHLRYVLAPIPETVFNLQSFGIFAGYVSLFAIFYILLLKVVIMKDAYKNPYNLFLLATLTIITTTGILMRLRHTVDTMRVKYFVLGLVTFEPQPLPLDPFFLTHYITSLILLCFIPSHIFAAPLTIADAIRRERDLRRLLHEER